MNKYGVDLLKLQMKITYLWMIFAILAPGAYVALAYFLNDGQALAEPAANSQMIFWIFLALSLAEIGLAFLVRSLLMKKPAIVSVETFDQDFSSIIRVNFIIVASLLGSVALNGLLQFFVFGAEVKVVALFCILSVIGLQLIRPREKFLQDALCRQEKHVAAGRFTSRPPR